MAPAGSLGSFSSSLALLSLVVGWSGTNNCNKLYSSALLVPPPTSAATKKKNDDLGIPRRCRGASSGHHREKDTAAVVVSSLLPASNDGGGDCGGPDYLITDSLDLDDGDRPTMTDFAFGEYPREGFLRLPFLLCGTGLSACNVLGLYQEDVYAPLVASCVGLGLANAVLDAKETKGVSDRAVRRGSIDARVLQAYASTYSAAVCWLAIRVYPPVCPDWLKVLDPVAAAAASALFAASLVVPLLSLLSDAMPGNALLRGTQLGLVRSARGDPAIRELPPFSPLERRRAVGLLAIGLVACLYLPVSSYLALYGDDWWSSSLERYPQQGLLETSTALFGLLAAQSNISLTRAAGYGVKPVREMVVIGVFACLALAVVPCASALYFLRDGTTFFDHYYYHP